MCREGTRRQPVDGEGMIDASTVPPCSGPIRPILPLTLGIWLALPVVYMDRLVEN